MVRLTDCIADGIDKEYKTLQKKRETEEIPIIPDSYIFALKQYCQREPTQESQEDNYQKPARTALPEPCPAEESYQKTLEPPQWFG